MHKDRRRWIQEDVLDENHDQPEEQAAGTSPRAIIAAVILLVGLVLVSLWLSGTLRSAAQIQDCVAGGRTNCAPIR